MVFNSLKYVLFLIVLIPLYYIVPKKYQNIILLVANYIFYAIWSIKYSIVLFACTGITFGAGVLLDKARNSSGGVKSCSNEGKERRVFVLALILVLLILGIFKYINFAIQNLNLILGLFDVKEISKVSMVLPVGISFFTFQSAGYLIDIYKRKYPAEHSFINYAIFVSFFPQILSGPIGRGDKQLPQYKNPRAFKYDNLIIGGQSFLWGLFVKMVISDRIAILVNTVYNNFYSYTGMQIIFATICYGLQIYTDFCGYSSMAIGSAKMLGIISPENFNTPYFSQSIKEFWRRWHISFSSWLRDYVYIPLGGNRCSKARKNFNIITTFLISGLWHGAQWNYVAWGLLHGAYQIIGDALKPAYSKINKHIQINTETTVWKITKMIITFGLIDFAWLFFRADGFMNSLRMIKRIITELHPLSLFGGSINQLGLNGKNLKLLAVSTIVLFIVDIFVYKDVDVREWFRKQNRVFKWGTFVVAVLLIVLTGIWGNAYDASSFIYFKF